ncbi:hypothetical protein AB4Y42_40495 [Paraburkholderia sp. EG286B]|uniref:hypothetical protein n=1 Tax=Paraburkholderia sp. EG286B TaxID=3237011 RepID=UPI0034D33194
MKRTLHTSLAQNVSKIGLFAANLSGDLSLLRTDFLFGIRAIGTYRNYCRQVNDSIDMRFGTEEPLAHADMSQGKALALAARPERSFPDMGSSCSRFQRRLSFGGDDRHVHPAYGWSGVSSYFAVICHSAGANGPGRSIFQ